MFGYTWGPGGIRRGPIWQSSNTASPMNNWFFFNTPPGSIACNGTARSDIVVATMGGGLRLPDLGSSIHGFQELRPDLSGHTEFSVPSEYYKYETHINTASDPDGSFTDILADERSMVIDVDLYVSPYYGYLCDTSGNILHPAITESTIAGQTYKTYKNILQLTNSLGINNRVPSIISTGQGVSSLTNNVDKILCHDRALIPPCAMRIRGKMVYSDYCFAMARVASGDATASKAAIADFPVDTITQYLEQKLNDEMPSYNHNGFIGSSFSSPGSGNYYQDWTLGGYQDHTTFRCIRSDNSADKQATQHYHYCHGNVYGNTAEGVSDFTFYFSPCIYPMYYQNPYTGGGTGDQRMTLANSHSQETTSRGEARALFIKHADPGFLSPRFCVPVITQATIDPVPSGGTPDSWELPYIKTQHGEFKTNNWSQDYTYLQSTPLSSGTGNRSINQLCICADNGVREDSYGGGYYTQPHNIVFNNPGPDFYNFSYGIIQPKVVAGTQYLQDVNPCCASYEAVSGTNGGFSGRYKFVGFKGTISFFEM